MAKYTKPSPAASTALTHIRKYLNDCYHSVMENKTHDNTLCCMCIIKQYKAKIITYGNVSLLLCRHVAYSILEEGKFNVFDIN